MDDIPAFDLLTGSAEAREAIVAGAEAREVAAGARRGGPGLAGGDDGRRGGRGAGRNPLLIARAFGLGRGAPIIPMGRGLHPAPGDGTMRTSASGQGRRRGLGGRGFGGHWLRLGAVGGIAAATVVADASCSLIVNTNANQCSASTVASDCAAFPGLRSCVDGVCQVATTAPTCTSNTGCSKYASATCTDGVCARICTSSTDCETASDLHRAGLHLQHAAGRAAR